MPFQYRPFDWYASVCLVTAAYFFGGFVATHLRHLTVHEHAIVSGRFEHRHCFTTIASHIDTAPEFLQQQYGDFLVCFVVFREQHMKRPSRIAATRSLTIDWELKPER